MAKLKNRQREQIINALVTNCGCQEAPLFVEADIPLLNETTDERLIALETFRQRAVANAATAEAARNGFELGGAHILFNEEEGSFVANGEMPEFLKKEGEDEEEEEESCDNEGDEMDESAEYKDNSPGMAGNAARRQPRRKPTINEWMKSAPPEIQSVVANAVALERQQKTALINVITTNNKEISKEDLAPMNLAMLRKLAAGYTSNNRIADQVSNYLGAAAPTGNARQSDFDENDVLLMPTINYSELASEALTKGKKAARLSG